MAFPSTPQLTDFSILGDAGPPPTGDYDNGLLFDSMVIASGLCAVDPASMSGYGDAPYTTALTLPVEAWAILGPLGSDPYASVYVYDSSKIYIFNWLESGGDVYYFLVDESYSILWSSTNEYSTLTEGSGLGVRATGSQIECYISPDGSTWSAIHTESITLSGLVQIGLGSFPVVG